MIVSRPWRVSLNLIRLALGLTCLLAQLAAESASLGTIIFAAVFTVYGFTGIFWRKMEQPPFALLGLFFNAMFFLVYSVHGVDPDGWISSALYLHLLLSAFLQHDWGDVFIISGMCMVFFGIIRTPHTEFLRQTVMITGLLACVLAIHRRKASRQLEEAERRAEEYRAEAEKARITERQRIAGDFHDGPLQNFIGFQVRLDILRRLLERDQTAGLDDLSQLQDLAKTQVAELRSFLRTMRPQEVTGSDLVTYARRLTEDFQKDTGITVRFISSEAVITASPEIRQEILQILREALKNVQKHSCAGRVLVSLEKAGKSLVISVDDNGSGFGFSGTFSLDELELLRMGPNSIKRRVRSLGGELVIESRPGQGAGVKIRVPS